MPKEWQWLLRWCHISSGVEVQVLLDDQSIHSGAVETLFSDSAVSVMTHFSRPVIVDSLERQRCRVRWCESSDTNEKNLQLLDNCRIDLSVLSPYISRRSVEVAQTASDLNTCVKRNNG